MAAYWGIASHSAYDMFSWYMYLSVGLVFKVSRPLGLLSGDFFLIVPFLDHCLLVLSDTLYERLIIQASLPHQEKMSVQKIPTYIPLLNS